MKSKIQVLFKSHGFRSALALGTGTAIGQAAVVVASPVWSRLYSPADFGRYGLIASFLATATVGVSLRYEIAIPLARDRNEALKLVCVSLLCMLPASGLAGAAFLTMTSRNLLGFGSLDAWSGAMVVIALLFSGAFTSLRYWHVREGSFSEISVSLVAQGLGRSLMPILIAPLKWGWLGLLSGELVGRSLGMRRLAKSILPLLGDLCRQSSFADLFRVARLYRQYPVVFLPSSVLDAASAALPVPIIVALYGVAAGGQFLLAQQIVLAPAALISGSLGDIFHSRLVPGSGVESREIPKLVVRTAAKLLLLASAVYVPVACLAPFLAVPIFGSSWSRVGAFVAILTPATIIMTAVSPVSRAIFVSRVPQIKLIADLAKLILPAIGLMSGSRLMGASLTASLISYSIMLSISYGFYFAIIMWSVRASNQLESVQRSVPKSAAPDR